MESQTTETPVVKVVRRTPGTATNLVRRRVTYDSSLSRPEPMARKEKALLQSDTGPASAAGSAADPPPMAKMFPMTRMRSTKSTASMASTRSASGASNAARSSTRRVTLASSVLRRRGDPDDEDDDDDDVNPEHRRFAVVYNLSKKHKVDSKEVNTIYMQFESLKAKCNGNITIAAFRETLRAIFGNADLNENGVQVAWQASTKDAGSKEGHGTSVNKVDIDQFLPWCVAEKSWAQLKACTARVSSEEAIAELSELHSVPLARVNSVKSVFDTIDDNGSGILDYVEFEACLKELLGAMTEERVARHWKEADSDEDGEIDFPEFLQWHLRHFSPEGKPRADDEEGTTQTV